MACCCFFLNLVLCRSYLPGEPDPSQRRTQRWRWFHFFLCKQGSTSSHHNELFKAPICGYRGLLCPSYADNARENLNYSCQGSLCSTGPITKCKQVAQPIVRSLYQQTDSCQVCPSRWHKERRKEGKKKQWRGVRMNEAEGIKSGVKVSFLLCDVCLGGKEREAQSLLLI